MNQPCESSPVIYVAIADESRMGSELLAEAVKRDHRLRIRGSPACSTELLRLSDSQRVDVAVISPTLDGHRTRGFQLTRELLASSPRTQVVMLVDPSRPEQIVEAFRAGARGVLSRNESLKLLCKCIRRVHTGQVWATSSDLTFVLQALMGASQLRFPLTGDFDGLSRREQDVVRCVTEGLSNRTIAQQLELSEHTVRNYLSRIFEKLGVSSRIEILFRASVQSSARESSSNKRLSRDPLPSFEWAQEAAENGFPGVQFILGEMYREGTGCPKDEVNAYMWFSVAETTSSDLLTRCRAATRELAAEMTNVQIAEAELRTIEWLRQRNERPASPGIPEPSGAREPKSGKERAQIFPRKRRENSIVDGEVKSA